MKSTYRIMIIWYEIMYFKCHQCSSFSTFIFYILFKFQKIWRCFCGIVSVGTQLQETQTIKVIGLIFFSLSWPCQIGLCTCILTLYLFSIFFSMGGGAKRPPWLYIESDPSLYRVKFPQWIQQMNYTIQKCLALMFKGSVHEKWKGV